MCTRVVLCLTGLVVSLLLCGCAAAPAITSSGPPQHDAAVPPAAFVAPREQRQLDRAEFARRMSRLEPDMTEREAVALLGPPDAVRTLEPDALIRPDRTARILCYGVAEASGTFRGLPTLGQIYVDDAGRVQYVFGAGEAISSSTIDEPRLRELLQLIDRLPPVQGLHYNPLPVVQAVNALQPLGKDAALAVIEEYLRVTPHWPVGPRQGVFVLLRVLFDLPENTPFPEAHLGHPSPPQPINAALAPRFPIVILGDVPFLVVSGYTSITGPVEPPETHVAYFRQHGVIRPEPLRPTDHPMLLVDQLLTHHGELFAHPNQSWDADRAKAMLANQVLWLVDSVYRVPVVRGVKFDWCCGNAESLWARHLDLAAERPFIWDPRPRKQHYTYTDGTTLKGGG